MGYDDPRNYEPVEQVCRTCEWWRPALWEGDAKAGLCSACEFDYDEPPWRNCDMTCRLWEEG